MDTLLATLRLLAWWTVLRTFYRATVGLGGLEEAWILWFGQLVAWAAPLTGAVVGEATHSERGRWVGRGLAYPPLALSAAAAIALALMQARVAVLVLSVGLIGYLAGLDFGRFLWPALAAPPERGAQARDSPRR